MPWATPQLPFELTEWWWLRQCEAQASRCCLRTRNCGQTRHRPAIFETMSEEKTLNDNRFPKDFYISETTWNSELSNTPVQRGLAARVNGPVKDRSLNQPFHIWITPLKFASLHQQTLGIRRNQKKMIFSFLKLWPRIPKISILRALRRRSSSKRFRATGKRLAMHLQSSGPLMLWQSSDCTATVVTCSDYVVCPEWSEECSEVLILWCSLKFLKLAFFV